MTSGSKEFLWIEPKELRFPFEANKQISCSMQFTNRTDHHIAFKVKNNNPRRYCVLPNISIVPPRSTCDVNVTMGAQSEAPPGMQCEDKFLVQSVLVSKGTTLQDLTQEMFKKDPNKVGDEVHLKVVYIQPQQQRLLVRERSEEGLSPHPSWSGGGNKKYQDVEYVSKKLLRVGPDALCFPFETKKQITCSMKLTNITDGYIAFKVKNTNPKGYLVRPNISIVAPRSTYVVNVIMKSQEEAPLDMQCKDMFLVQSVVVKEATTIEDITNEMFRKQVGNVVDELKLKVLYVKPPSLGKVVYEEGSSPHPSCSDGGNIIYHNTESTLHMPLQQLKDITNNFSEDRLLGRGGFGVVYKGVLPNENVIAVKKFVESISSSQEQFENEVNLLRKLEHPNIVRLVGFCYETKPLQTPHEGKFVFAWDIACLLCLEYLSKGSLDKYISGACSGLDWPTRLKIIEGVSYGLQYLHEQSDGPIIHLDLKPANILLNENMIPKITDFGLSRLFDQKKTIQTSITRGTLGYMAPEYLRGIITPTSDIFSLGVLIMEVITGHKDYPNDIRASSEEFIKIELKKWRSVLQTELGYTSLEEDCEKITKCIQIGLICVNPERTRRPTMKKIIDILEGLESMDLYISNELTSLPAHVM